MHSWYETEASKTEFATPTAELKNEKCTKFPFTDTSHFLHLSGLNIKFLPCTLVGGIKCQNAQVIIGYTHLQTNAKLHKL